MARVKVSPAWEETRKKASREGIAFGMGLATDIIEDALNSDDPVAAVRKAIAGIRAKTRPPLLSQDDREKEKS